MPKENREKNMISFFINRKEHNVEKDFPFTTTLSDYLRDVTGFTGTKVMCSEAGCGCCAVSVTHKNPSSDRLETYSVQSCLMPLYVVDGWQITTVEGIGNQKIGFHPIQDRIAKFNGSQCGYCTPGVVMNMYGLLHQNPKMTCQEIEDSFDGNICRCTGYRPILDAMKSFANDSNVPLAKQIDIEDLNLHLCPKTGEVCYRDGEETRCLEIGVDNTQWFRPSSLVNVAEIVNSNKSSKIKLLFGNTANGIYKNEGLYDIYVDLHNVKEIYSQEMNESEMKVGGGMTLTELISRLKANQDKAGFGYFGEMVKHLKMVANVMVRNAGSVAGNLMIKHSHPEFPSDLFTLFVAAGAKIELYDCVTGLFSTHTLLDFFTNVKMDSKVLTAIQLPKHADNEIFKSFRVSPRSQNAHAYVNAAFRLKVSGHNICEQPSIVYGGISAKMVCAKKTGVFLDGKTINKDVIKESMAILKDELNPDCDLLQASSKYRKDLACSFLYKVLLGICGSQNTKLVSGQAPLHRPISSGLQMYQERKSEFPLKKAMPKKTSSLQASGEAIFVNDMPKYKNELFAAFVLAQEGNATLDSIDASEALKMPGVVSFLSAKDIPEDGVNNFMPSEPYGFKPEEVFATKEILFSGQAVGLILAETKSQAFDAVSKVKINYAEVRKPVLTLDESIALGKEFDYDIKELLVGQPDEAMKSADKIVSGEIRMGSQTHFCIENHISLAVPSEDGLDLFVATQFPDCSQCVAANVIGKPMNYVNVTVPRVGGAFGGKTFDSGPATAAASLAAYLTDSDGKIQAIEVEYYFDCGCNSTATAELFCHLLYMDLGYHVPHWKIHPHPMMTNKQRMSAVRAPGAAGAALMTETIMEHAAKAVNMHPIPFKELNLIDKSNVDLFGNDMKDSNVKECWQRLKDIAEVEGRMRRVDYFNQENLWKKRGITMTVIKYGVSKFGSTQGVHVSIYARDGTVFVSQSGVEMGQGLYTKVAQGVAHTLGIPIDLIKVRPNQNCIVPNTAPSGGSTASETATQAAIEACRILRERMQPIKEKFPDLDWKELCKECAKSQIDLAAKFIKFPSDKKDVSYFVHAAAATETEVDVLTGESQVLRVDFMGDFGESINPAIDIGQIEGAFVMGLGCYLSEDTIFDDKTGRILNDGTWDYKPPTTKDIPIDWRIHLLPDKPNPYGVLSSKAVGEPPLCLSVGALLANKAAVLSARQDLLGVNDFMDTEAPYTAEKVHQSVGLEIEHFTV